MAGRCKPLRFCEFALDRVVFVCISMRIGHTAGPHTTVGRVASGTQTGLGTEFWSVAVAYTVAALATSYVKVRVRVRVIVRVRVSCLLLLGLGKQHHNHVRHGSVAGQSTVVASGLLPVHLESSAFQPPVLSLPMHITVPFGL